MFHIESMLSARLFLSPQIVDDRIYFISNISGHLSLYAMDYGGSVPEPLLPPQIALQNPILMEGYSFFVFPNLNKILVMIDQDGDENYQPMAIPIDGGFPEPGFKENFGDYRVHCMKCDPENNLVYLRTESRIEQKNVAFQGNFRTGELVNLRESKWGTHVDTFNPEHTQVILLDSYTVGDNVLYLWDKNTDEVQLIYGTPLENRNKQTEVCLNAIESCHFTAGGGLLFFTALFSDTYGLGYLSLQQSDKVQHVTISGTTHEGKGEFESIEHIRNNNFSLKYNIDGCTWIYEGTFNEDTLHMEVDRTICGWGELSDGMVEEFYYNKNDNRYCLSFSTATSPTQIFTIEDEDRTLIRRHTNERILGIPDEYLSTGEDASFTSFDGTRISAKLYLPSVNLNYSYPRPLAYYIHGGPQSQERPDFAWFSMPLIQYLTLNGFSVFVPNVRGSSGYGLKYMKLVDRDWGGEDRLDHVFAMEKVLPLDIRVNTNRAGIVGRSYGGYMTLMLAARHPELWAAAVDMFGPYDLTTFLDRLPETWKPYFSLVLGNPENDRDRSFLIERSPRTYIDQISSPLLVIQGKNDPRVIELESRDVVEYLRSIGKEVEYLMFDNEGHDVLKYKNRVTCYNEITSFFTKHLRP